MKKLALWLVVVVLVSACGNCPNGINTWDTSCPNYVGPYGQQPFGYQQQYGQPYFQPYGQPYAQPYGQPHLQGPYYGQPYPSCQPGTYGCPFREEN
jgi:hypothetical protein